MTERKITYTLKKIEASKASGNHLDALIRLYHLNLESLRFLALKLQAIDYSSDMKPRHILTSLLEKLQSDPSFKTFASKKNLKTLKPWLIKMDEYLKTLRMREPSNTQSLFNESEKILGILKLSVSKILISEKK